MSKHGSINNISNHWEGRKVEKCKLMEEKREGKGQHKGQIHLIIVCMHSYDATKLNLEKHGGEGKATVTIPSP